MRRSVQSWWSRCLVAATAAWLVGFAVPLAASDTFEVVVPRTNSAIRLDGRLDDPAWATAQDLGPLTQREPREGTPPSEQTRVLVMADGDHLYVGVLCYDSDPAGIVRRQMTFDGELGQDDNIETWARGPTV